MCNGGKTGDRWLRGENLKCVRKLGKLVANGKGGKIHRPEAHHELPGMGKKLNQQRRREKRVTNGTSEKRVISG